MELTLNGSLWFYSFFFFMEVVLAGILNYFIHRSNNTKLLFIREKHLLLNFGGSICFVLMISLCVIVAYHRYGVGSDYFNYYRIFKTLRNISGENIYNSIELIPSALMLFFKRYEDGYFYFLGVCAFIIASLTFEFFKENAFESSLPYMVFIYFMIMYSASLNALRQILAVSIILHGYKYIINKDFKRYCVVIILATLCHKAALLCIAFYFLSYNNTEISKVKNILIVSLAVLSPFFIERIFLALIKFPVFESFSRYTLRDASSYGIYQFLVRLPVTILIIVEYRKLTEKNEGNHVYALLFLMELLSYTIGANITWAFRMSYFCIAAEAILVPQAIKCVESSLRRYAMWILYSGYYFFMFWYNIINNGHDGILPYIFR